MRVSAGSPGAAILIAFVLLCPACSLLESPLPDNDSTLNSSVVGNDNSNDDNGNDAATNGGGGVQVAGGGESSRLRVVADRPFCCNPYERDFQALVDNRAVPPSARCTWDFGDGYSADTCDATHVFHHPGRFETVLTVTLVDRTVLTSSVEIEVGTVPPPPSDPVTGPTPGTPDPNDNSADDDPPDSDDPSVAEVDPPDDGDITLDVDAGANVTVEPGDVVQLKATVLAAPNAATIQYIWQQVAGPDGTLSGGTTAFPSFTVPDAPGETTFVLSLTATAGDLVDTDQVSLVMAGSSDVARADDPQWGFDPAETDSTDTIQAAIDSGRSTVIIPDIGRPWVVRPLHLHSDMHLLLEAGAVVEALPGAYPNNTDSLISAIDVENVTIEGYGATLRMSRDEYDPPFDYPDYVDGEWRHALNLRGARQVEVLGVTVDGTGGDGVYVSPTWDPRRIPCANVTVRDCTIRNSYRNGMTIVSGSNVLVDNCYVTGTGGTAPQSSIHIEAESHLDRLVNVEVRNSTVHENEGSGFVVNVTEMDEESEPVSVLITDCHASYSRHPSLRVMMGELGAPLGTVDFRRCEVETIIYSGAWGRWDPGAPTKLTFTECTWRDVARNGTVGPLEFVMVDSGADGTTGGLEFVDCQLYDENDRDPMVVVTDEVVEDTFNIFGHISVFNAAQSQSGPTAIPECPDLTLYYPGP